MAPELVKKEEYNEKVDIWSVGIIACILLTGKHPFSTPYESPRFFSHQPQIDEIEDYCEGGTYAGDFIRKCLEKNIKFRYGA